MLTVNVISFIVLNYMHNLFVSQDFILWTFNSPMSTFGFIFIIIEDYLIIKYFIGDKHLRENKAYEGLINIFSKKRIIVPVLVFALYLIIPSVTVFTDNSIVHRSPINIGGTVYNYSDIVSAKAGVRGYTIPFISYKGDFYYIIEFSGGEKVNLLDMGSENTMDTYSVIEQIDQRLMQLNVEKAVSTKHFEKLSLDQKYINRFKRILNNK